MNRCIELLITYRRVLIMGEIKNGIAWDDKYNTGYEKVDSQHRQLFALLSDVANACSDGSDTERLRSTINFLVDYTVRHFHDEEALQIQWNYPDYACHKQLHDDFKETVAGIVSKYGEKGSSAELSDDVNKIIVRWIVNHIQREDKKIGDYIRKKDSRFNER